MYDSIVIGAGIAGIVVARELAEKAKEKVLVIEKRDHIGGNCFDKQDEQGILIHPYGPHIFHTNSQKVFDYLSQFTQWRHFKHEVAAKVNGEFIPVPFNLNSLYCVYSEEIAKSLEKKLIDNYGLESSIPILKLQNSDDVEIRKLAKDVYELIFLKYTMKQWGQTPDEVDPSVTGRVPVQISYDNSYFQDRYQGVPELGYTKMFARMLDHPSIELQLGVDAKDQLKIYERRIEFSGRPFTGKVIYTGAIDELFDYQEGALPYRSLDFRFEHYKAMNYQGYGVVNYTVSEEFTRITEFKLLTGQKTSDTTIVKEYPRDYLNPKTQIPYYAVLTKENQLIYEKYRQRTQNLDNFYLLGRLAEYQYFNMDVIVERALNLSQSLMKKEMRT